MAMLRTSLTETNGQLRTFRSDDVAMVHAGESLTDSEFLARYGLWKDRDNEPGRKLLKLIEKEQRPGRGWMS
jgi:hypothetical protein